MTADPGSGRIPAIVAVCTTAVALLATVLAMAGLAPPAEATGDTVVPIAANPDDVEEINDRRISSGGGSIQVAGDSAGGFRFTNVCLDGVVTAHLQLTTSTATSSTALRVTAHETADAPQPGKKTRFGQLARTTEVLWQAPAVSAGVDVDVDVTAILADLTDADTGFSCGSSILFIVEPQVDGQGDYQVDARDRNGSPAELHLVGGGGPEPTPTPTPAPEPTATPGPDPTPTPEPTPPPEPTATPAPEPTATPTPEPTATPGPDPTPTPQPPTGPTDTFVSTGMWAPDDVEIVAGVFRGWESTLDFATDSQVGLRFRNVCVGPVDSVESAVVQLTSRGSAGAQISIAAHGTGDAPGFGATQGLNLPTIQGGTATLPAAADGQPMTFDVTNLLRQLSARADWVACGSVSIIVTTTSGSASAYAYDANQSLAASMTVTTSMVDTSSWVRLTPSDNIEAIVQGSPEGTRFLLAPGTYGNQATIHPKDDMWFVGEEGAAPVVFDGTGLDDRAFRNGSFNRATAVSVVIANMHFTQYDFAQDSHDRFWGVIDLRPPNFTKDDNTYSGWDASVGDWVGDWRIHDVDVYGNQTKGIELVLSGSHVTDSRIHDNAYNGIEGSASTGLRIYGNAIYRNAAASVTYVVDEDTGATAGEDGPKSFAGGIKLTYIGQTKVATNHVYDNSGTGIWIDISGYDVDIDSNRIERSGRYGIYYEISYNARIQNNVLIKNNRPDGSWVTDAAIMVTLSTDVTVDRNHVDGVEGEREGIFGVDIESRRGERDTVPSFFQRPLEAGESGHSTTRLTVVRNVVCNAIRNGMRSAGDAPTNMPDTATWDHNQYFNVAHTDVEPNIWTANFAKWRQEGWDANGSKINACPAVPLWASGS